MIRYTSQLELLLFLMVTEETIRLYSLRLAVLTIINCFKLPLNEIHHPSY